MLTRHTSLWVLATSFALSLFQSALAQPKRTGLAPTPPNDYAALPGYDPSKVQVRTILPNGQEVYEMKVVPLAPLPAKYDLTDRLPKPGEQRFNDCTAWAVSRGAYSYQLGRSRGRKPAEPFDLFSPRFVYAQINDGSDTGSYIYRASGKSAVSLLLADGCATEASCPYDASAGGWNNQPPAQAKVEAKNFKALRHERVSDLDGVKRAVSQHVPVILAIYCDNTFFDNNNTAIYTAWAGNPTNAHALCVVGYDNAKGAVKLMNSWGDSWKNDGFGWASYTLLSQIEPGKWCYEAHAIRVVDENPPIGAKAGGKTYVLNADGSVTREGVGIHSAGYATKLAATSDWPYLLRPNGRVFTLRETPTGPVWADVTSAPPPSGLGGQQVAMFAATATHLYALTPTGRVYARIPGPGSWDRIDDQLPQGQAVGDLRLRGGAVVVTTKTGRVFKRVPGAWQEQN